MLEPSASITYISWLPSLRATKASLLPSGDQVGCMSSVGWLVRRVMLEPSSLITYISGFPSLVDTKAILPGPVLSIAPGPNAWVSAGIEVGSVAAGGATTVVVAAGVGVEAGAAVAVDAGPGVPSSAPHAAAVSKPATSSTDHTNPINLDAFELLITYRLERTPSPSNPIRPVAGKMTSSLPALRRGTSDRSHRTS